MMKGKKFSFLMYCACLIIFCVGCGKKEEIGGGSVRFNDISVEIIEEDNDILFAHSKDKFFMQTVEIPFLNNCAVYEGKIYRVSYREGTRGLLSTGGTYTIDWEDLRDSKNKKEILELAGMEDGEDIEDALINEGLLYCSWKTGKEEIKSAVVELESGTVTEFSVPSGRRVEAVTTSGYYYLDEGKIYFVKFKDAKEKLFLEMDEQVQGLYRDGDDLCAFVEQDGGISLLVLGEKGKVKKRYDELEKVEGLQNGTSPILLREKEGILYYMITAKKEGTSYNTWLICADLEKGTRENCGGWYTPISE